MCSIPVHSTVVRAGSPHSTLLVWPLCPYNWGWAHPAWGVGVRGPIFRIFIQDFTQVWVWFWPRTTLEPWIDRYPER